MTADLITRLIAGPGSQELDALCVTTILPHLYTPFDDGIAVGIVTDLRSKRGYGIGPPPKITTSLDAAVAFAVAAVGVQKAIQAFRDAQAEAWWQIRGPASWFDALPRHIVAEVLKARNHG